MRRTFLGEHVTLSKQLQDLGILEVEIFFPPKRIDATNISDITKFN